MRDGLDGGRVCAPIPYIIMTLLCSMYAIARPRNDVGDDDGERTETTGG
jgi:hypothetical protein